MSINTFQQITDSFIKQIEAGIESRWAKPWISLNAGTPINASTGKPYQGINVIIGWLEAESNGYPTQHWATFKQWQQLGASVKRRPDDVEKGEWGTSMLFWKRIEKSDEAGEERSFAFARRFTVFNAAQVEGWDPPQAHLSDVQPVDAAQRFFDALPSNVVHGGDRACYSPAQDLIRMPDMNQFETAEAYYATLAHEHGHWTGHKDRLDRDLRTRFDEESYAMEELTAELTAAFICSELSLGLAPRPDHVQYLDHWLRVLRADAKALWTAAKHAQRASAFLLSAAGVAAPAKSDVAVEAAA
jgi:antirestriction protein ArdC